MLRRSSAVFVAVRWLAALGVFVAVVALAVPHAQTARAHAAIAGVGLTNSATVLPADITPPGSPSFIGSEAIVMDPTTEHVYYSVHADREMPMASTTKIMTTIIALTYGKLDQKITVSATAAALNNPENSSAGLHEGDVLTLHDLLYGMMLPSGDDAAEAIAEGVAGSASRFVSLMNAEAALLGLAHTHYVNVHGLDANGHYTTARDLAELARFALSFKLFRDIVSTPVYSADGHTWVSTNTLLLDHYNGVIGIKTGHTGGAGFCLVFLAKRSSGQVLGVVLGEDEDGLRFSQSQDLMEWSFTQQQRVNTWKKAVFGA